MGTFFKTADNARNKDVAYGGKDFSGAGARTDGSASHGNMVLVAAAAQGGIYGQNQGIGVAESVP